MTLKQWIKKKIMGFTGGVEKLSQDPNSARFTFISNDEEIRINEIRANRVWYIGDGNELLNYYTEKQAIGFNDNPIYNRNKRNYFWSLSSQECDIKRVHSGVPNAIITTITNIIGAPSIDAKGWDDIEKENNFYHKLVQQARPMTLVEGFGAWKVNFNTNVSKYPLWEYYSGEFVEYVYKCGILMGIIFKSYYKDKKNNDYVLIETRYRNNGNSYIEYNLFKQKSGNEIEEANLDDIPELKDIPREKIVIEGLDEILAVPSQYLYDPNNQKYGRSIYAGKLDLFDMLDEILSQASQTVRVSTPVEYYSPDVLERGPNGLAGPPKLYNRQFVQKAGIPDGDGKINQDIITTQPELDFDKYGQLAMDLLTGYILTGVLSPCTLGIDISRRDNADAQREKEKVTIMTRNTIIDAETDMMRKIVFISKILKEYIDTGSITLGEDEDITVKYVEFANPSFENQLELLGRAWNNGQLSTQRYVDLLWGDKLSEQEKAKEILWLDNYRRTIGGIIDDQYSYQEPEFTQPKVEKL